MNQQFSFSSSLRGQARSRPDQPAFTFVAWHEGDPVSATVTFAELDALADRVANCLLDGGVRPGDRVGLLCRNQLVHPAVLYGASRARAVPVTINWRLAEAEMRDLVAEVEPRFLIATREFADLATHVADLAHTVVLLDESPSGPDLEKWLSGASSTEICLGSLPDELAMLCYTAGTTGRSKGVMTTNAAVRAHLDSDCYGYLVPGTCLLNTAPTFHAAGAGMVWAPLEFGAHVMMLDTNDPEAIIAVIDDVDAALLVPAVLHSVIQELRTTGRKLPRLRSIVYGASPISSGLLQSAFETIPGARFYQTYGMTETTGPLTQLLPSDHLMDCRLDSAGSARRGVELMVRDVASGTGLPTGEVGEVVARSAQLTSGYWRRPAETTDLFTADGWLRTGDLGFIDDDGFLHIRDRLKDMIVTGGENVYAIEVENVLSTYPGVEEVCVVGVAHEHWGEAVHAVVVGDGVDVNSLVDYARGHLAHYKCPQSVELVDSLPKSPAGKVLRRMIRDSR